MRQSIRIRLLFGLIITIVTLWITVLAATYYGAQHEVGALFDTQLEQSARVASRTLLGLPVDPDADDVIGNDSTGKAEYQKNLVIQVWDDNGELLLHSDNAPLLPLSDLANGFENTTIDEERWRIFSFYDESNKITIRTGEPLRPRRSLTQHVVRQTVYPVLIGLPLATLLIWLVVSRGLSPLKRLAAEIHRRNPENLANIDAPYAPSEVVPLIEELNSLLDHLKHRIEKERNFVGDAAHELRTPLSGLKAQAEVALGARNDKESRRALNYIMLGVDRASHMVNQLLTLSRIDEDDQIPRNLVNINGCIQNVLRDVYSAAQEKSIELDYENQMTSETLVSGYEEGLYALVRNLADNAIKYSPTDSRIEVVLKREGERVTISVRDYGCGISKQEQEKVFDRFHRRNQTDQYGAGLGLSIVKRVVELHNGRIFLATPEDNAGLLAIIELPTAEALQPGSAVESRPPLHPDGADVLLET